MPLAIIVALVVAAAVFGPGILESMRKKAAVAECDALRARRRVMAAVQGANVAVLAQLDAELVLCAERLAAMGIPVDSAAYAMESCDDKATQIDAQWTHYKSTSYSDPMQRDNTRGAMLRLGEEMAACYQAAADRIAAPPPTLGEPGPKGARPLIVNRPALAEINTLLAAVRRAIGSSNARITCYLTDGSGCGRFAVSEEHGNDKARHERERVLLPLRRVEASLVAKREIVDPQTTAQERAALAQLPSASVGGLADLFGLRVRSDDPAAQQRAAQAQAQARARLGL